jgi:hypothetical protein
LFQFIVPIVTVIFVVGAALWTPNEDKPPVLRLLALVIGLIIAAMVAGAYWHFNPAIAIFLILGFGVYMVGRIGGPLLPASSQVGPDSTYGIYLDRDDFVPPDPDSHSGGHLRDGVDPNERKAR